MKNILIAALSVLVSVSAFAVDNAKGPKAKNQKAWNKVSSTEVVSYSYETEKGPKAKNSVKVKEEGSRTEVVSKKATLKGPKAKNRKPFNN